MILFPPSPISARDPFTNFFFVSKEKDATSFPWMNNEVADPFFWRETSPPLPPNIDGSTPPRRLERPPSRRVPLFLKIAGLFPLFLNSAFRRLRIRKGLPLTNKDGSSFEMVFSPSREPARPLAYVLKTRYHLQESGCFFLLFF